MGEALHRLVMIIDNLGVYNSKYSTCQLPSRTYLLPAAVETCRCSLLVSSSPLSYETPHEYPPYMQLPIADSHPAYNT
jgi:hypothetical protein